MKLIIAGSRSFSHEFLGGIFPDFTSNCHQAVHQLMGIEADIKEIVHGGCPSGVDSFADLQWDSYYDIIETSVFKADWNKYGKFAGPKRNSQMAAYGDALFLIWDGKSRGSLSMKNEMLKRRKPIFEMILCSYNVAKSNNISDR